MRIGWSEKLRGGGFACTEESGADIPFCARAGQTNHATDDYLLKEITDLFAKF